jgi:serine/threonine-protein kinase RsbW
VATSQTQADPPSGGDAVDLWVHADVQAPGRLRRAACALASAHGASRGTVQAMALAVSEAVTNAVLYAYPEPRPAQAQVHLRARVARDVLEVVVADDGAGMRAGRGPAGLGAGLALIEHSTSRFEVRPRRRGGTEVWMSFALEAQGEGDRATRGTGPAG